MTFYSSALRPALFALDPEHAHDLTMAALRQPLVVKALGRSATSASHAQLSARVTGVDFRNPIGLAAGLDKQGTATAAWPALGFGFAEIGTVTPRPQPGNPKPRLFRLARDLAIINRFGFNSAGADAVARNVSASSPDDPRFRLGINIGKNKDTPNERAVDDYVRVVDALYPSADYFAINVSSPNTAGLRDLQEGTLLRALVEGVVARVAERSPSRRIPVLVKVSPDGAEADLLRSVDAAIEGGASGVIATNTTVSRPPLRSAGGTEAGGLSGAPLRSLANDTCRTLFRHVGRRVPIIGVGGIFTADDAYERFRAGASLVQIYTALIFEGPGVVERLLNGLTERLSRDGLNQIGDLVGVDTA